MYQWNSEKNAYSIKEKYNSKLISKGFNSITTEIVLLKEYFIAENYHQQYLSKNPTGYCGLGGTGIKYELNDVLTWRYHLTELIYVLNLKAKKWK